MNVCIIITVALFVVALIYGRATNVLSERRGKIGYVSIPSWISIVLFWRKKEGCVWYSIIYQIFVYLLGIHAIDQFVQGGMSPEKFLRFYLYRVGVLIVIEGFLFELSLRRFRKNR